MSRLALPAWITPRPTSSPMPRSTWTMRRITVTAGSTTASPIAAWPAHTKCWITVILASWPTTGPGCRSISCPADLKKAGENHDNRFIYRLVCRPGSYVAQDMVRDCILDRNRPLRHAPPRRHDARLYRYLGALRVLRHGTRDQPRQRHHDPERRRLGSQGPEHQGTPDGIFQRGFRQRRHILPRYGMCVGTG